MSWWIKGAGELQLLVKVEIVKPGYAILLSLLLSLRVLFWLQKRSMPKVALSQR